MPTCAQISLSTFIHYQFVRFLLNKKRILSFTSTRKVQIPPVVGMTINLSFRDTRNLAFLILSTHNFLSFLESRFLQIPPIVGMTTINMSFQGTRNLAFLILSTHNFLSSLKSRFLQIPPIVGMTFILSFRGTRNLDSLILNTHNFLSFLESRFLQIPPIVGMTFILSFRLQGEIFPLLPATFYLLITLFPFLIPNYLFLSLYKVKKAFAKQSPLISFYAIINLK